MGKQRFTYLILATVLTAGLLFQNCGNFKSANSETTSSGSFGNAVLFAGREGRPLPAAVADHYARFLYARLAGIKAPMSHPVIDEMTKLLTQGKKQAAAELATSETTFIDITVRDFASRMATREGTVLSPLNDFTATVMGLIADDRSAREFLTTNSVYIAAPSLSAAEILNHVVRTNDHYDQHDTKIIPIAPKLEPMPQKLLRPGGAVADHPDPAGLLTTRTYMLAHAFQGTNRRVIEYAFKVFLCAPIDSWASMANPDSHVGRDIGRQPIEDFNNKCKGCHTGMDGMRPASAFYDYFQEVTGAAAGTREVGYVKYQFDTYQTSANHIDGIADKSVNTFVPPKFRRGAKVFEEGFVVEDDEWINYADQNMFGWNSQKSGAGMKALGAMLAQSDAFPRCMAKRVFEAVCGGAIDPANLGLIEKLTNTLKDNDYNLRKQFAVTVLRPECGGAL